MEHSVRLTTEEHEGSYRRERHASVSDFGDETVCVCDVPAGVSGLGGRIN